MPSKLQQDKKKKAENHMGTIVMNGTCKYTHTHTHTRKLLAAFAEVEITVGHQSFSRAYHQIVRPQVYILGRSLCPDIS